jgi:pyruvate formate lyase activating enzyme
VALDIKTSLPKYKLLGAKDTTALTRTVEILKTEKVPYEFRTTVVPELVTAEDVTCIGELVKGSKNHAFQQFVPNDTLDKNYECLKPYPPETIAKFAENMKQFTQKVTLRI